MKSINETVKDDELYPKDEKIEEPQSPQYYSTLAEALSSTAPAGSTVKPIGFDNAEIFLRAGYRTVERDQDVTVVRGGETEFAAARKEALSSKLIVVPTHDYAAAATSRYRAESKAFARMKEGALPHAAVFDANELNENAASIFGELIALDMCAYDMTFASRMRGESVDVETPQRVAHLLSSATDKLRTREKDRRHVEEVLTEAGKTAAKIVEECPKLLHCSGAAQTYEAHRMLCRAENRQLGMRGETEAVICFAVCDFYIKNITDNSFRFPPDNARRIDSVCEYFGADIRCAAIYADPIYPPIKMRLYEYRRNEFRAEITKLLAGVKSRQAAAVQVFKRLYPDDGYGVRSLVDKTDLPLCLALAPDVFAGDSMLSFLKQTGKLEEYIV
ncbi:MAG: hypothetical protein J1F39_05470 [Clostridiales bacterium]|nr:hypothetical protein [Clostridiales bacterium]